MNSRYENYIDNSIYNKNGNMQRQFDNDHPDYFYQPTFLE